MSKAEKTLEVVVRQRRVVADGIISLELVSADGTALPRFEPGSHIDVYVSPKITRQYSLCNDPAETNRYMLGILLDREGRGGSAEIHDTFQEGKTIRIGSPRNNFTLVKDARKSILIAGGIGVTPLLAMAHWLQAKNEDFELHYCSRSRERMAFVDEIANASFGSRVRLHSDDGDATTRFDPSKDLPAVDEKTHIYVCGPDGFMDWVLQGARELGYGSDNIHVEHFAAKAMADGDSFEVECSRSGKTLTIPSGSSIADVMVAAGIEVSLSCEQGICGACLTNVLEGTPDHHDMYQTDEEKATNSQITPCCSRSLTPKLVLDI
jgi:ferredoxin-NADP reductase